MSRFDLDNLIIQATSMNGASESSKQPRWQRKNDSQMYNSFNVSNALNQTGDLLTNMTLAESNRQRNLNESLVRKQSSQNHYKTPAKTPKKSSQTSNKSNIGLTPLKTPSRSNVLGKPLARTPKTPIHGNDRYIPNRNGMDLEKSYHLMTQANKNGQENEDANLRERLGSNLDQYRIMCYTDKAPAAPEGQTNNLNVLYSSSKTCPSAKKSTRVIRSQPEKVLDAPDLLNDWYLNLLSWSSTNIVSVALNRSIYLWNAVSGETTNLLNLAEPEYVSSTSWVQDGSHLAVGTSQNLVEIWDVETSTRLRQMGGHSQRISCLDWNAYTLSSGSKSGLIFHHDVRVANHHVGTLDGHAGHEVCGLKWSTDGKFLASGSNDNSVNIWSGSNVTLNPDTVNPLNQLQHVSAVKALAWCPWKPHLIATGGGTADRQLKVWNSLNANCLYHIDTGSQISGIEWNEEYQEIVSAHGFQNCEINIWKFPTMTKVGELRGHMHRILSLCMSPDRSTVASLAADETLRFWECFATDLQRKKKAEISAKKTSINPIRMMLR